MTIPMPAAERVRALRRMKLIAGGLLVLAAAVYIVCRALWHGHGAAGYVQAAAEASMVGGLADWFAVTALFRYPLGLPIPHTAIIPRKKDQIGSGLAGFVNEYFLTEEIVGERLAAAQVPQRIGQWLADPDHAHQVAEEISKAVGGVASVLRDDEIRNAVAGFADKQLRQIEIAPIIARLLDTICDSGQHQAVFTSGLRGTMRFLDENRSVFRRRLDEESPEWVPEWVDDRVFAKGFSAVQSFLADVSTDSDHELRHTFDRKLREVAERLRTDPEHAAKVEQAKLDLLDRPDVRDWLSTIWLNVKKLVLDGAADPNSDLRRSAESLVISIGVSLRDDPAIGAKVDEALQRLTGHIVADYGDDLASVISATVERWDTAETSRRLELQVGRDLQFIRINGTVVGSLAGLAIYAITQLF